MNTQWHNPKLAQEYSDKLDQVDWYEHEVNMPSLLSLMPQGAISLLDFGSGPGQFTNKLAAYYEVTGADVSGAMVDIASTTYPNIKFIQWDGQSISPIKGKFDIVFSKLTLHFVEDIGGFAQNTSQLLNNFGHVVVSLPHPIPTTRKVAGRYATRSSYDGAIGKYDLHVEMIHRSLEAYVQPFLDNGFSLTGLREPLISDEQAREHQVPLEDLYTPKRLNLRFTLR